MPGDPSLARLFKDCRDQWEIEHIEHGYQRTTTFRIHEPIVMPGIFQTEAYIRRMLAYWYQFLDAPEDADDTVAMKAERRPDRRGHLRRRIRRASAVAGHARLGALLLVLIVRTGQPSPDATLDSARFHP